MDDPGTDARRQGIETVDVADGVLPPWLAPILPHTGEPRIRGKVDCAPGSDVDSAAVVIACGPGEHRAPAEADRTNSRDALWFEQVFR